MDVKRFRLNSEISNYGQVNSGFAKVKILVNTYDQIANGTKFSRELLDSKMSKLNYLPIVGEFKEEDFGTHGGKVEITDEGIEFINTTRPYGVVIENSGRWEKVRQKNGEEIEYVVCDGYVWCDRYPELNVLFDGKQNNQSMEIQVTSGHYEDGVYYVDDFEYSALCILGKDVAPAFNEAKIEVNFESQDFKAKYNEMLQALDKYLANFEANKEEKFEKNDETDEIEETEVEENKGIEGEEEFAEQEKSEVSEKVDYELEIANLNSTILTIKEQFSNLQADYNVLNEKYNKLIDENKILSEYKAKREAEIRAEQEAELFDRFSKLDGDEEYEKIKLEASNYSIKDLEKEIALIYARKTINFSAKPKEKNTIKVSIDTDKEEKEILYGGLFEKYAK